MRAGGKTRTGDLAEAPITFRPLGVPTAPPIAGSAPHFGTSVAGSRGLASIRHHGKMAEIKRPRRERFQRSLALAVVFLAVDVWLVVPAVQRGRWVEVVTLILFGVVIVLTTIWARRRYQPPWMR